MAQEIREDLTLQFSPPEPLSALHLLEDFECGEPVLDEWVKRRALANQSSAASRTFVVADQDRRVRGYYAMAAGAVAVSRNAGVRALLVHALNDQAKQFYERYGFQAAPTHPMTLMLRLTPAQDQAG